LKSVDFPTFGRPTIPSFSIAEKDSEGKATERARAASGVVASFSVYYVLTYLGGRKATACGTNGVQ
jgi:hypothetical protein